MKEKLYEILEAPSESNRAAKFVNTFILILILVNVLAVILSTESIIQSRFSNFLRIIEMVSIVIFSIEYALRLYVCNLNKKYQGQIIGRIKYIFSFYALVDLLAILPFYLPRIIKIDLRFIRIIRLLRIFRILKLARYSASFRIIASVLKNKKEELSVVIFILLMLMIISSCLMYTVENEVQPEAFRSILSTMWWSVATLSTVGYGDIYPITALGKLLASVIALLGIGLFALPTAILGSGFMQEIGKKKKNRCPHCGSEL